MSSQGANTTVLSTGYAYNSSSVRDSSDITRQIRERVQYNQQGIVGVTRDAWVPYGNQFRLSYLYGKYKCTTCTGNIFSGS